MFGILNQVVNIYLYQVVCKLHLYQAYIIFVSAMSPDFIRLTIDRRFLFLLLDQSEVNAALLH